MIEIQLATDSQIQPNGTIKGEFHWKLEKAPKNLEVHLLWYTSGRGTEDVEIIETEHITTSGNVGQSYFSFNLPNEPYSFSGKLITLTWAIEVVATSPDETKKIEFMLSPTGREVSLAPN